MRTFALAASLLLVASPTVAGDRGVELPVVRSAEVVLRHAKLRPWRGTFELYHCTITAAKRIAERPAVGGKLERDSEAEEAMAGCKEETAALAKIAPPKDLARTIDAYLRAAAIVINIARSPRSVDCARPEDAHCLVTYYLRD